jgi:hypothetical protein
MRSALSFLALSVAVAAAAHTALGASFRAASAHVPPPPGAPERPHGPPPPGLFEGPPRPHEQHEPGMAPGREAPFFPRGDLAPLAPPPPPPPFPPARASGEPLPPPPPPFPPAFASSAPGPWCFPATLTQPFQGSWVGMMLGLIPTNGTIFGVLYYAATSAGVQMRLHVTGPGTLPVDTAYDALINYVGAGEGGNMTMTVAATPASGAPYCVVNQFLTNQGDQRFCSGTSIVNAAYQGPVGIGAAGIVAESWVSRFNAPGFTGSNTVWVQRTAPGSSTAVMIWHQTMMAEGDGPVTLNMIGYNATYTVPGTAFVPPSACASA